jgi:hypothetical protein
MRRRRAYPALLALVVLVAGQLAGFAHEAEVRHVTCGEHGEELEAATLAELLHACDQDHLIAVEGSEGGDHEDCAISRALHQSTHASPFIAVPVRLSEVTPTGAITAVQRWLAIALYLIAPKTSPPHAA